MIEDLARTNLLDQTLVVVSSEMGRKPKIGDPRSGGVTGAGRDHWTACQSILLAGGGIRGGQTYGASDRYGEYPDEKPLSPASITKTVYHAMGIDNLMAFDREQRPLQHCRGRAGAGGVVLRNVGGRPSSLRVERVTHASSSAAIPGNSLPSSSSSEAPPPVEM